MLKKSAKKRRLPFTITQEWFKDFISKTDYMQERGRLLHQLNIDRDDVTRGYEPGNLKVISKAANLEKYHTVDKTNIIVKGETEEDPF